MMSIGNGWGMDSKWGGATPARHVMFVFVYYSALTL